MREKLNSLPMPLTCGFNNSDTDIADGSYLENVYAQSVTRQTRRQKKADYTLIRTWGTVDFSSLTGIPQAGLVMAGITYVVTSTNLYSIDSLGVGTSLGTVSFSGSRVTMAHNGTHLVMCGREGYWYSVAAGAITQFTSGGNYYPSEFVLFLDGFFVFLRADTQNYFISGANAITLDVTEIASEENIPDRLLAMSVVNRELWLFGSESIAQHYNSAGFDFPFKAREGPYIELGIGAKYSVAADKNNLAFMGNDRVIYKSSGAVVTPISDGDVEAAIAVGVVDDAFGFIYSARGHVFYQITFPTLNLTCVYDFITGFWHKRSHSVHGRHFANFHMEAHGIHIIGDFQASKLYQWSHAAKTDVGDFIHCEVIAPVLHNDRRRLKIREIGIDMTTGVGLTEGQGSDPKLFISVSKDNKKSWGTPRQKSIGKLGEHTRRVTAFNFGSMRQAHIRWVCNDAVDIVFVGLGAR